MENENNKENRDKNKEEKEEVGGSCECTKCDEKAVQELEGQVGELTNKWKRALADYQNLEKRYSEEKSAVFDFANFTILYDLLDVLDNLEMAQEHLKDDGVGLCVKKFKEVLKQYAVSEMEVLGKDFDANTMEGVDIAMGEEGKVLKINKKGYLIKNRVLRPAQVVVGKS